MHELQARSKFTSTRIKQHMNLIELLRKETDDLRDTTHFKMLEMNNDNLRITKSLLRKENDDLIITKSSIIPYFSKCSLNKPVGLASTK